MKSFRAKPGTKGLRFASGFRRSHCWLWAGLIAALSLPNGAPLWAQVETVEGSPSGHIWLHHGQVEGHLPLRYSPAGAFSPDSSALAVVTQDKVALMDLRGERGLRQIVRPRVENISELEVQSASFVEANRLFLLATGVFHAKGEGPGGPTPLLAFLWDLAQDAVSGKVNAVGAKGGYGPARYFPEIRYLSLYKDSNFDLWNPVTGQGARINIASVTRQPNLYEFSPDGHWLLLAQIEGSATADPVVVQLSEHRFVDVLQGHHGTVLGISFSRESKRVLTACEDGKVRVFSVPEWKPLETLSGHQGPVHWAEFSPDGQWVASGGEDKTVRVWSAGDGKLEQTLEEAQAPVLTVAFSPNGEDLAATTEKTTHFWRRVATGR